MDAHGQGRSAANANKLHARLGRCTIGHKRASWVSTSFHDLETFLPHRRHILFPPLPINTEASCRSLICATYLLIPITNFCYLILSNSSSHSPFFAHQSFSVYRVASSRLDVSETPRSDHSGYSHIGTATLSFSSSTSPLS